MLSTKRVCHCRPRARKAIRKMAFTLRRCTTPRVVVPHYYSSVQQLIILPSTNLLFFCPAIGLERIDRLSRARRVGRPDRRAAPDGLGGGSGRSAAVNLDRHECARE